MAVGTSHIQQANPGVVKLFTLLDPISHRAIGLQSNRHAAGLQPDHGRHCQHLGAFPFPWFCSLMRFDGGIDQHFHRGRLAHLVIPARQLGAQTSKAVCIPMTIRAGLVGCSGRCLPNLLCILNGHKRRIFKVIHLQRLSFSGAEPPAGNDLVQRVVIRCDCCCCYGLPVDDKFASVIGKCSCAKYATEKPPSEYRNRPFHTLLLPKNGSLGYRDLLFQVVDGAIIIGPFKAD